MITQQQNPIPVPFHGTTLYIIEIDGNPYVPMKPIVEGMGLDWKAQYRRLIENEKRFCMVITTIQMPGDDQHREIACIPLRKLPGWLMTIQPSRVKPEIRATIIAYQNECDDVLWAYWTQGHVVNPRMALPQDFHSDLLTIAKAAQESAKAIQASFSVAQSLANTVSALVDKYAHHIPDVQAQNSLTCPHIVDCEQRNQSQLPSPTATTLAVTSKAQLCADATFLTILWEFKKSQPFTAGELYRIILTRQYPALSDAAIELLGDTTTWTVRKLGQILGRWSRSEVSCYRVLNTDASKNGIVWRLERVS